MTLLDLGRFLVPRRQKCPGMLKHGMFSSYNVDCDGDYVLRMNSHDKNLFWGCSNYPGCTHGAPFTEHDLPHAAKVALYEAAAPPRRRSRVLKGG